MSQNLNLRVTKQATTAAASHGPALFALIRNEDYFLPFFFDHYRSLGIQTFLIYDDRSDAPTKDFLNAQPDCAIVESDHGYGDDFGLDAAGVPRRLSMALKESVPPLALPDRWVLTVDADEFLVLPSGVADLPQLVGRLDGAGQPYLTASMVDFYGPTLNHRNYDPSLGPFAANPYFDRGPYYYWRGEVRPYAMPAGLRHRLMMTMLQDHPDEIAKIYGETAYLAKNWKVPLLKTGVGIERIGDHEISVAPTDAVSGALAHFKLHPGLDHKIDVALAEGQYFNRSQEYAFLRVTTRLLGDASLVGGETRTFDGPRSLEQAQLMTGATS